MRSGLLRAGLFCLSLISSNATVRAADVDFVRDIQPIFEERCYDCHGPDSREAGLRLDQRGPALAGGDSGKAIIAGRPDDSLLIQYVSGVEAEKTMPPDGDNLTKRQIELLRAWVAAGADWPDGVDPKIETNSHWAYQPNQNPAPPAVANQDGVTNPIDQFVLARLEQQGIAPSPQADRSTLLKRLHYDLLGLPPSPEEAQAFIQNEDSDAYEALVDRLLKSPHFGERWGRHWLDMARYADSDGYEKDNPRYNAWRYRDWVINAINADLPFDQFTIEQLAGDLLPDATESQRIATGFHRQTLTNTEGGTDKEEFRVAAVFDRIETIGSVWLGLTVGCARCHSHKYDAISQREYFQFFAFFNNAEETDVLLSTSQQAWDRYAIAQAAYEPKLAAMQERLQAVRESRRPELAGWAEPMAVQLHALQISPIAELDPELSLVSRQGATLELQPDGSVLASGALPATDVYEVDFNLALPVDGPPVIGVQLEAIPDESLPNQGPGRSDTGNFVLSEITFEALQGAEPRKHKFSRALAAHSQGRLYEKKYPVKDAIDGDEDADGWAIDPKSGELHLARFYFEQPIASKEFSGRHRIRLAQLFEGRVPHPLGRFRLSFVRAAQDNATKLPLDVQTILLTPPESRTPEQGDRLFDEFVSRQKDVQTVQAEVDAFKKTAPFKPEMSVAVMTQRADDPRVTRVMRRGNFMEPLDPVSSGTLDVLPPLAEENTVPERLAFARWLVSDENPLTPRVTANHIWSYLFGQGLVRTTDDFGVRGERPSHPELLDWLALELRRSGWSRKTLIKTIVMSSTYRQSAAHRSDLADIDPNNHLLARQNRFRVEAEIVGDLFLAASGLLQPRIGGPSVFPPLPPGIAELSYANNFTWGDSIWNTRDDNPHGVPPEQDIHRRGMYTFFKRTAAHPNLTTFDCPDANTACIDRMTSNTPLQALQTLNNQTFVSASRALADRVLALEQASDDSAKAAALFQFCLPRPPSVAEQATLQRLLADSLAYYQAHPDEAIELVGTANRPEASDDTAAMPDAGCEQRAAWTVLARVMLNLDEFITRE